MNDYSEISDQLFKIIKGFGNQLVLFTDDGQKTVDPEEARRIYIKNLHAMVTINEQNDSIVVSLSKGIRLKSIRPLLDSIRKMASQYIIGYTVKTFGKIIKPKDFMYQAESDRIKRRKNEMMYVKEGFSGWHGSRRRSVNELDNSRLLVRHKKFVDESKRGARTRQIHSIFIENHAGERFQFPSNNLNGAKAMLRHIREGGEIHDPIGAHITAITEEMDQLKTFQKYNRKHSYFESVQDINEGINTRINEIRMALRQMQGPRGYKKHYEKLGGNKSNNVEQLNELQTEFARKHFNEEVAGSLPYLAKIVENVRGQQENGKKVIEIAKKVLAMADGDGIEVHTPLSNEDPDNPANQTFADGPARVASYVSYLSPKIKNDELANSLMRLSDLVFDENLHPKMVEMAEKVVKAILQNTKHVPNKKRKKAVDEEVVQELTESIMSI